VKGPLTGPIATWRLGDDPIYRETVAALGVPALPGGAPTGGAVVASTALAGGAA
jgi:hypothetical protein